MKFLKSTVAAALFAAVAGCAVSLSPVGTEAQAQQHDEQPVTYVALVWIKPGKEALMEEYEAKFRAVVGASGARPRPVGVFRPNNYQTNWPNDIGYRLPDRIDVVEFPNANTWPDIQASPEWQAIRPLREEALERLVLMETTSLLGN